MIDVNTDNNYVVVQDSQLPFGERFKFQHVFRKSISLSCKYILLLKSVSKKSPFFRRKVKGIYIKVVSLKGNNLQRYLAKLFAKMQIFQHEFTSHAPPSPRAPKQKTTAKKHFSTMQQQAEPNWPLENLAAGSYRSLDLENEEVCVERCYESTWKLYKTVNGDVRTKHKGKQAG